MKAAPTMQKVITAIAQAAGVDLAQPGAHFKIENPPFMALVVENVDANRISVAHYYEQNGDLCPDPDMVFWVQGGQWFPVQIQQTGFFKDLAEFDDDGVNVERYWTLAQADAASFARIWARNIREQKFLQAAKAQAGEHKRAQEAGCTCLDPQQAGYLASALNEYASAVAAQNEAWENYQENARTCTDEPAAVQNERREVIRRRHYDAVEAANAARDKLAQVQAPSQSGPLRFCHACGCDRGTTLQQVGSQHFMWCQACGAQMDSFYADEARELMAAAQQPQQ